MMYQQNQLPIVVQPQQNMVSINRIPPGLECLLDLDYLFVKRNVEMLEVFTGIKSKNRFKIFDSAGRPIFYARKHIDIDCFALWCLSGNRSFDMSIVDWREMEVIYIHRPLVGCGPCCVPCSPPSISIDAPRGNILGTVQEECSFIGYHFKVNDASGNVVLRIKGPFTESCCFGEVEFRVLSVDGRTQVGRIARRWSGFARELFTGVDYFGIHFPKDLDVKMKAVMIGACFLINFMFYENHE